MLKGLPPVSSPRYALKAKYGEKLGNDLVGILEAEFIDPDMQFGSCEKASGASGERLADIKA